MKKILCVLLCAAMLAALSPAVMAANKNLVYDKDATLSANLTKFGDITVKSGAHVVAKGGFEIAGKLTVEPGGSFTGVKQSGDFTFSLCPGASVTGLDLYYPLRNDNGTVTKMLIPVPISSTWNDPGFSWGMNPSFKWDTEINGWCLSWTMGGNPFHVKLYHMGRDMDTAKSSADRLNRLGLFFGTGVNADGTPNYELSRSLNRVEAVVMLIRLLGKESTVNNGSWSHPFTDVPGWADKHIGYAYETGLAKGVDATHFGVGNATPQQYLTFLLRALGYTDEATGSTVYNEAMAISEGLGLLAEDDEGSVYNVCFTDFWRADAVVLSLRLLNREMYTGGRLFDRLAAEGVITPDPPAPPAEN